MTIRIAEYERTVDYFDNETKTYHLEIEYVGQVEVNETPKAKNIQIDMTEIARMKAERDAKLDSGSFWK